MIAAMPFSLGIPEFGRPGFYRVSEVSRQKQKHIDVFGISASITSSARFPMTFDGSLPSEAFREPSDRVLIGETYHFPDAGEGGLVGKVTEATVSEQTKEVYYGVSTSDGRSVILKSTMTDADFAEYVEYRDVYFGVVKPAGAHPKDEFELFEWLMEVQKNTPRETMLSWFSSTRDRAELEQLSDEDLRITYCEGMVAAVTAQRQKPPQEPTSLSSAPLRSFRLVVAHLVLPLYRSLSDVVEGRQVFVRHMSQKCSGYGASKMA